MASPRIRGLHPYFKLFKPSPIGPSFPRDVRLAQPWTVPDLCKAYGWPSGLAGGGVIGIIEMGGGFRSTDLTKFFNEYGQPVPAITNISVDGVTNNSPGGSDADYEVALDIQVAGCAYFLATGKAAEIRVYWHGADIAAAVKAATADGCDVFSCSWGNDEAQWGQQGALDMEAAASQAASSGMVVFAAAGDNDSSDGGPNAANVDCPGSCPSIVCCGGTMKPQEGVETVWNNNPGQSNGSGTGGGFSTIFALPSWQRYPSPPHRIHRMVPDCSANADPSTGYKIIVDGQDAIIGGTSAVAPLYAGLFAAFGRKLGFATPKFYQSPHAFSDITVGNNGVYHARPGPDACTGMGSPIGTELAKVFVP